MIVDTWPSMGVSDTILFAISDSTAAMTFYVILLRVKFLSLLLVILFHWRKRKRCGEKLLCCDSC